MATDFLARIERSPVLCDGAMGTLLYAKGIIINRSYDELNLSQPDLIRAIDHEYLQLVPRSSKPTPSAPILFG
jgi:methionine synthase I (cobalamin-dependent)